MPNTSTPVGGQAISWSSGSNTGGAANTRRVATGVDQIKANDINQLRDILETLYNHYHTYTDRVGGGGNYSTTTC